VLRYGVWGMAALIVAAGLWISYHYTVGFWSVDSDTVTPLVMWAGVHQHGLGFLSTWRYTGDNWLLSVLPIAFASYWLFGTGPQVVLASGWAAFVVSIGLTSLLARMVSGSRPAVALACVLPFANLHALGWMGFLSYPLSHDISMAWGLLALALAAWGLGRGPRLVLFLSAACILIDAASDPWAMIAIGAPLLLVPGLIAIVHRRSPAVFERAVLLGGLTTLALLLAQTRLLGLLWFLPPAIPVFLGPKEWLWNLRTALHALAVIFNVVPTADAEKNTVRAFDLVFLFLMIGAGVLLNLARWRDASPQRRLVIGVAVVSIVCVWPAFLTQPWPAGFYVGRFFPNLFYFGALLGALGAADAWPKRWFVGAGLAAYGALFALSGVLTAPAIWLAPARPAFQEPAGELGAALAARGLSYGYTTYSGGGAPLIEEVTGGRVVARAVSFRGDRVQAREWAISNLWFTPGAAPPPSKPVFLAIPMGFDECPSLKRCADAAAHQFGPPDSRFEAGDFDVLVWNHAIVSRIGR
jgi:hypothetical protein